MWTKFWDMHSGGRQKEQWARIYIEAPEQEARVIFYNRFGHNPERVTCTCCGSDYSTEEGESLLQLSAYHRGCDYAYLDRNGNEVGQAVAWVSGKGMKPGYTSGYVERKNPTHTWETYRTLEEYMKEDGVLIIYTKDIKPEERVGDIPEQGYVWID